MKKAIVGKKLGMTQIFLHGFNIVSGFQAVHGDCVSEIVEPKL